MICAICLNEMEDRCVVDNCLHEFCFSCLMQWASISLCCPLCKQEFKACCHGFSLDSSIFLTYEFEKPHNPLAEKVFGRPRPPRRPKPTPTETATIANRRLVYRLKLKAVMSSEFNSQSKIPHFNPEYLKKSKTRLNSLIPWIQRDLKAILDIENVDVIQNVVLAVLAIHEPTSDSAANALHSYLGDYSSHFLHELLCFAASPFGMLAYDNVVMYPRFDL